MRAAAATVFLTCSPALFESETFDNALTAIRCRLPGSTVITAREHSDTCRICGTYHSCDELRELFARMDRLACFADDDGFLSLATWMDCEFARKQNRAVSYVTPYGELLDFFGPDVFIIDQVPMSDWTRFVRTAHRTTFTEYRTLHPELSPAELQLLQRAMGE